MFPSKDILARSLWFFDYDGSLCPHTEVWEERTYDPGEILIAVKDLSRIARGILWNTGRRPISLEGVRAEFLDYSGYFVQGSVRWDARTREATTFAPKLGAELGAEYARRLAKEPRLRLEIKETGLRIASILPSDLPRVKAFLKNDTVVCPPGWTWIMGHRGAELLPDGFDKGFALRNEMPLWPPDTVPVAVGDDVPDRPAFEEALKRGGFVVAVGDSCGWVTEIPHQPSQVIFCETPADVSRIWQHR